MDIQHAAVSKIASSPGTLCLSLRDFAECMTHGINLPVALASSSISPPHTYGALYNCSDIRVSNAPALNVLVGPDPAKWHRVPMDEPMAAQVAAVVALPSVQVIAAKGRPCIRSAGSVDGVLSKNVFHIR